jgi:hypothetical protein
LVLLNNQIGTATRQFSTPLDHVAFSTLVLARGHIIEKDFDD